MLSYDSESRDLVLKIREFLLQESMKVWLDGHKDTHEHIYNRYERKQYFN